MARRRYVSTDISVDKRMALLAERGGDFAALLYTWMIPHATDDGGITADPDELRLTVVPGFKKKTPAIIKAVEVMLDLDLLEAENGRYYFPSETFYKYQNYVAGKNRRNSPQNAAEPHEVPQNPASPSPPPSLSPSPSVVVVTARASDEVGSIVSEFATFGNANALTGQLVEEAVADYGCDWVKRAVRVAAKSSAGSDHPPWGYVETTLKRWRQQGEPDDDRVQATRRPAGRGAGSRASGDVTAGWTEEAARKG